MKTGNKWFIGHTWSFIQRYDLPGLIAQFFLDTISGQFWAILGLPAPLLGLLFQLFCIFHLRNPLPRDEDKSEWDGEGLLMLVDAVDACDAVDAAGVGLLMLV